MGLAAELGLLQSKIDEFAASYHGHPDSQGQCLTRMFSYWLNNDDKPSYNKLKKAVEQLGNKNEVLEQMKTQWPSKLHESANTRLWNYMLLVCNPGVAIAGDELMEARRDALGPRVDVDNGRPNRPEGDIPDYIS